MQSHVRLYAILARKAPLAVVFRRGPSSQVQLISWNTENDTLEYGQWFRGRVYERRCDLSPDGRLLLYFAASYRQPYYSWSAVSRPPYLTALALWPKGDGWGGGGHFVSATRIDLNHRATEMNLAKQFSVPRWLKLRPFGDRPGWGEDDPVWSDRLKRDGWTLVSYPTGTKDDWGAKVWIEFSPPITWHKPHPKLPRQYCLEMSVKGLKEKDGPWYLIDHAIVRNAADPEAIGRSDWADWSYSGDLLLAKDGCLLRLPFRDGALALLKDAVQVADLSGRQFENCRAPQEFLRWPTKSTGSPGQKTGFRRRVHNSE